MLLNYYIYENRIGKEQGVPSVAQMPSFSRMCADPVPKLSSPQMKPSDPFKPSNTLVSGIKLAKQRKKKRTSSSYLSIRLPKNFHPVGTSKSGIPNAVATLKRNKKLIFIRMRNGLTDRQRH